MPIDVGMYKEITTTAAEVHQLSWMLAAPVRTIGEAPCDRWPANSRLLPGTMTRSDLSTLKIASNMAGSLACGQGEAGVASMGERLAGGRNGGGGVDHDQLAYFQGLKKERSAIYSRTWI